MSKIAICMADGCEEIEGLTVVDLVRRAKLNIDMISINGTDMVKGSHGIEFKCDKLIEDVDFGDYQGIVLPGGIPGTPNLESNDCVTEAVKKFAEEGKMVAAICAAPSILGHLGILDGKKATSYPGFDREMSGCKYKTDSVVKDGNIITSRGMGTAIDFGLGYYRIYDRKRKLQIPWQKILYTRNRKRE